MVIFGDAGARHFEIGYRCRTSLAGCGYVSESTRALLRHAFRAPEVFRVEIRCDPRNGASERVIRKCGFPQGRARSQGAAARPARLR